MRAAAEVSEQQYILLFIDPDTGRIDAYGPLEEAAAEGLARDLRADFAAAGEDVGVLVLPLHAP